jgi:hypothetical protein
VRQNCIPTFLLAAALLIQPHMAYAYIGPGAGITAIGTVVALIGAFFLMIVGFVWYPVKRFRTKLKANNNIGDIDKKDSEPHSL